MTTYEIVFIIETKETDCYAQFEKFAPQGWEPFSLAFAAVEPTKSDEGHYILALRRAKSAN